MRRMSVAIGDKRAQLHREAETSFLLCVSFYIKESISYNSVYLILACVRILCNNEIETVNTIASNHQFHYTVVSDVISYVTLFAQ